jgi:hypothetical protein
MKFTGSRGGGKTAEQDALSNAIVGLTRMRKAKITFEQAVAILCHTDSDGKPMNRYAAIVQLERLEAIAGFKLDRKSGY